MSNKQSQERGLSDFGRRGFLAGAVAGTVGLAGCLNGPTEIETWHDLNAVRGDLGEDYALNADLDTQTAGYDEYIANSEHG